MKRVLISIFAVMILVFSAAAQESEPVPITQVPYRPVLMFLPVHVELFGRENISNRTTGATQKDSYVGFGAGILAGYPGSFKWQINLSFESFPASNMALESLDHLLFIDAQVGVRYFPQLPTFGIGRIPVRLTFSVQAGGGLVLAGNWTPQFKPTGTLTAGLAFAYGDNPWGLMIEFLYRPLSMNIDLTGKSDLRQAFLALKPSWGIRFSWLFSGGNGQ